VRLKRIQNDFRVFEVLDEDSDLLGPGEHIVYRVTKRGMTTPEAVTIVAREAGVERSAVAIAGLKDKDGISGQFMSVTGGRKISFKDDRLTIRSVGPATRPLESRDNRANSFEIVVRDLRGDDMRRVRVNLQEVRDQSLPAYFDDQRFGCLRHGQGFVVRRLLRGDLDGALKDLMCAPSPYGSEEIERYKSGIASRWGMWGELAAFSKGRRGQSLFAALLENPDDLPAALARGIATTERTIHLFAYQSHLWNRAAGLWIKSVVPKEKLAWLPCDDGALPVYRHLEADVLAELQAARLPLFGEGVDLDERATRLYEAVFRSEGVAAEDFLKLDLPGFRPKGEDRGLLLVPEFLRAAPAERDELYDRQHKMRLRFTLPRGAYATLVAKRLVMPTEPGDHRLILFVSRHRLPWPDDEGRISARPERFQPGAGDGGDDRRKVWQDRSRPAGRPQERSGARAPGVSSSHWKPARNEDRSRGKDRDDVRTRAGESTRETARDGARDRTSEWPEKPAVKAPSPWANAGKNRKRPPERKSEPGSGEDQ